MDRDLWKSRMSKFYYGCSNASKKFQGALFAMINLRQITVAGANFFVSFVKYCHYIILIDWILLFKFQKLKASHIQIVTC